MLDYKFELIRHKYTHQLYWIINLAFEQIKDQILLKHLFVEGLEHIKKNKYKCIETTWIEFNDIDNYEKCGKIIDLERLIEFELISNSTIDTKNFKYVIIQY